MLLMTRAEFNEICEMHKETIVVPSIDASEALWFALDVLEAEVEAIQEREPYATNSIQRLKMAMDELRFIARDVDNGDFF